MRAGFLITTEQGQIRVDVTLAEWLRLSAREGRPVQDLMQDAPTLERYIELMHWAAERTEQTDLDLYGFAATIIDWEPVTTADPKATTRAVGTTSSSPSKSKPARIGQRTAPKTS